MCPAVICLHITCFIGCKPWAVYGLISKAMQSDVSLSQPIRGEYLEYWPIRRQEDSDTQSWLWFRTMRLNRCSQEVTTLQTQEVHFGKSEQNKRENICRQSHWLLESHKVMTCVTWIWHLVSLGNVIWCYTFPVFCPGLSVCDISCLIDPSLAVTYTFSCESTPQTIVVKGNWFSFMEHQFLRRFIILSCVCMLLSLW